MIAVAVNRYLCWTIFALLLSSAGDAKNDIKVQELNREGAIAYQKHNYDAAILACDKALQFDPKYFACHIARGHAYHMKLDLERATASYEKAIQLIREELGIYYNRGFLVTLARYNMVLYLRNLLADAYCARSDIYARKQDFERALADLNEAIRSNPKCAQAFYYRGLVYQCRLDYVRALADFEASAHLDPHHYEACLTLAKLVARCHEQELRDHKKALDWVCRSFGVMKGMRQDEYEIKSPRFSIPIRISPNRREDIEKIRLFVSEDEGKNWKHERDSKPGDGSADFTAPHDGRYWFAVQVVSKNGSIEPAKPDKLAPAMKVYVNAGGSTSTSQESCEEPKGEVEQLRKKIEQLEMKIKELQSDHKPK